MTVGMTRLKSQFMGYGESYVGALLFFLFSAAFSTVIAGYTEDYGHLQNPKFPSVTMFNIAEVMNNFKLIKGIVFFAIRASDPSMAKVWSSVKCCCKKERNGEGYRELSHNDDIYAGQKVVAVKKDDYNFLNGVSDRLRSAYTRSIVMFLGGEEFCNV